MGGRIVAAVDGGTTNTRVRIFGLEAPGRTAGARLLGSSRVRKGASHIAQGGDPAELKRAIRSTLQEALAEARAAEEDLAYIAIAGAITSDVGIHFIPHVEAPADAAKFAAAAQMVEDLAISKRPILYCTGVKNPVGRVEPANSPLVGFMRGEEYETLGILQQMGIEGEAILVLPGSHNKFVLTAPGPEILSCISTLTGEMIEALIKQTILSRSVPFPPYAVFDPASALAGARLAEAVGLPQVGFSVRALDLFGTLTPDQRGSLLVGAVIAEDLRALRALYSDPLSRGCRILVGGSRALREAYKTVLAADRQFGPLTVEVPDSVGELAVTLGILQVAELAMAGKG